jgi:hypothetical protein
MLNEWFKLLESMLYHSWKWTVMFDEAWLSLSLFWLITNRIGSVQKTRIHRGRENWTIPEDDTDGRLKRTRISFDWRLAKGNKFHVEYCLSHILSPFP